MEKKIKFPPLSYPIILITSIYNEANNYKYRAFYDYCVYIGIAHFKLDWFLQSVAFEHYFVGSLFERYINKETTKGIF